MTKKKIRLNKFITIMCLIVVILSFIIGNKNIVYADGDAYFNPSVKIDQKYTDGGKSGVELAKFIKQEVDKQGTFDATGPGVWSKIKTGNSRAPITRCVPTELLKATDNDSKKELEKYKNDSTLEYQYITNAIDQSEKFDISKYLNGYKERRYRFSSIYS